MHVCAGEDGSDDAIAGVMHVLRSRLPSSTIATKLASNCHPYPTETFEDTYKPRWPLCSHRGGEKRCKGMPGWYFIGTGNF
jgi:hypothetical protein